MEDAQADESGAEDSMGLEAEVEMRDSHSARPPLRKEDPDKKRERELIGLLHEWSHPDMVCRNGKIATLSRV